MTTTNASSNPTMILIKQSVIDEMTEKYSNLERELSRMKHEMQKLRFEMELRESGYFPSSTNDL